MSFVIRLEFDGDPGDADRSVRGRVVDGEGRGRPFIGWLRLLAELELAVRFPSVAPAADRERDTAQLPGGS